MTKTPDRPHVRIDENDYQRLLGLKERTGVSIVRLVGFAVGEYLDKKHVPYVTPAPVMDFITANPPFDIAELLEDDTD